MVTGIIVIAIDSLALVLAFMSIDATLRRIADALEKER
jgi:hypothetical protein